MTAAGATPDTAPRFRLTDSTLRDGSHAVSHQFTTDQVRVVVAALDAAGVPVIEVTHGDGMGGSSFNYGFSHTPETDLLKVAVDTAASARIAVLFVPGIGVKDDLREAAELGVSVARIATHCTEADIAEQHVALARDLGMEAVGFLMMSHMVEPAALADQARLMASYGADCVYVVDSAGAMILDEVGDRVGALVAELGGDAQVGFHGHENLALGVANSLNAISAGAVQFDACTRRFGAGAGNTPSEALAAVCSKLGIRTGIDVLGMFDVAEEIVRPVMDGEPALDRLALIMGYAGVYSSFLRHAFRAAERYGVSGADILLECGERQLVGGQEDQIIDIAVSLADAAR
jgi:4-hydroxy 2-oxovalerate aldolase